MQLYTVYFTCELLYMFRVVSPPIIRAQITVSTASGTGQPLLLPVAIVEELRLRSTIICVPDDVWRNHLKHVQRFTGKINCV